MGIPVKIRRGGVVHYLGVVPRSDASRVREAARRQYEETGRIRARSVFLEGGPRVSGGWFWSHFLAGRELSPEQRLMLVVVEDARQQLNARSASARREARRWFMSNDRSYLHAFATICDAFDIDPIAVRAALE